MVRNEGLPRKPRKGGKRGMHIMIGCSFPPTLRQACTPNQIALSADDVTFFNGVGLC